MQLSFTSKLIKAVMKNTNCGEKHDEKHVHSLSSAIRIISLFSIKLYSMYSKQEAAQLKQQFWTTFGRYIRPVQSANGEKINWVNYKTGDKDIYFRMQADNKKASIAIEVTHKDEGLQALYFEQFQQLKTLLHNTLQEEWIWQLHVSDEKGKTSAAYILK
jgi:hypothetical protein